MDAAERFNWTGHVFDWPARPAQEIYHYAVFGINATGWLQFNLFTAFLFLVYGLSAMNLTVRPKSCINRFFRRYSDEHKY